MGLGKSLVKYYRFLLVNSSLCAIVQSPKALCRACLDICPKRAVVITSDIEVLSSCDGCGLCVSVCPNGVFQTRKGLDIVQRLQESGRDVTVVCAALEPILKNVLYVPCMGVVTEEVLLFAVAKGMRHLEVLHGDCERCLRANGKVLFLNGLERALSVLAEPYSLRVSLKKVKEDIISPEREVLFSRRELFSSMITGLQNMKEEETDAQNMRRALLLSALKLLAVNSVPQASSLFFEMKILEQCTGCPVCEAVCPMGAIVRTTGMNVVTLSFDPLWCTGCRNCVAACPERAIELSPGKFCFETLSANSAHGSDKRLTAFKTVAQIKMHSCPSCGTMIPIQQDLCITCSATKRRDSLIIE